MFFSPRSLCFVIPQTHATATANPPPPSHVGAALNRCCSVRVSQAVCALCLVSVRSDLRPLFHSISRSSVFTVYAHTRRRLHKTLSKEVSMEMVTLHTTKDLQSQHPSISQSTRHTTEPSASLPPPPADPPQPPARRRLSPGAWCANVNLCGAELSG